MKTPAYIVNTGIVTAIGNDTPSCLDALLKERTGVGMAQYLQTFWSNELPVAEIKMSNAELAAIVDVSAEWPRTALLSAIAVKEAWSPFAGKTDNVRIGF